MLRQGWQPEKHLIYFLPPLILHVSHLFFFRHPPSRPDIVPEACGVSAKADGSGAANDDDDDDEDDWPTGTGVAMRNFHDVYF